MTNKKKEEIPAELSEKEIYDVLAFAREMSGNTIYPGILTPYLVNARMRDLNLNPLQASEATLNEAMQNPKESELALQSFSQDFEIQSQVYKRLLSYLGNLLSFDLSYECVNSKPEDYKTKKYKDDLDTFKKFIDGFDFRYEFSKAVQEMLRNEAYFVCMREDTDGKMVFQELPSSPTYTMITGRWSGGISYSMNLYWFLQPGVDLNMYPKFFSDKYRKLWGDGTLQKYVPSLPPDMRGQSSWVYWQDIPNSVGWCFKFNPLQASRVPFFSGLFLDLIQQPLTRALQKNINLAVGSRLLAGMPEMLKDAQAKTKNQFAVDPEVLGKFLAVVKAGIGDAIKIIAAPLADLKSISFDSENEVYSSYLKTALATSGINTNLIFTSDVKQNTLETGLSLGVDEQMMYSLYPQFESFLNFQINKRTKNFKFKTHLEGSQFFTNREQRFDRAMELADKGMVLPWKISSSLGMLPWEFQRQMEEAKATGFVDSLTPIISAFQMSGDAKKGRPSKSDSELSDSGAQTRGDGGNIAKGGKK